MKRVLTVIFFLAAAAVVKAQNPVSWAFSAKKVADKTYELHLTATVQDGWHLYSQTQPDDAIVNPTTVTLNNNPFVALNGKISEVGAMEKFQDKRLGISANQYSNKVDFVQVVKLKGNVKTSVTGNVEFQTCNDERCLPPKKVNFSIAIK